MLTYEPIILTTIQSAGIPDSREALPTCVIVETKFMRTISYEIGVFKARLLR